MRSPLSTRLALGAVGLTLVLGATGAQAVDDDAFVPNTPTTEAFLTCGTPSKEYTVGRLVNDDEGTATWGPAAPASVTTGAGCGKVDDPVLNGANTESIYNYSIGGAYRGNLDTLTVTLHTADVSASRASGGPVQLAVRASVDGKGLFGSTPQTAAGTGEVYQLPAAKTVTLRPTATGATGGVRAYTFTITGIDLMTETDDKNHQVFLEFADATRNSEVHTWVWGAAEAPSKVVFTPAAPSDAVVASIPRGERK